MSVVQLGQYLLVYAAIFFFFLVALEYRENSLKRNQYVNARPMTMWNSFYMLSLYSTLALFALQMTLGLVTYWILIGAV